MVNKINSNWLFGSKAGLNFSNGAPMALPNLSGMDTNEGCASVSDKNGNLIFYTDGVSIWEGINHTQIYTGLKGNSSSTQSSIIVPDPSNPNRYYVLTTDGETTHTGTTHTNNHFDGIRIDVSDPDPQNWAATIQWINTILPTIPNTEDFSPTERITAIQHNNCTDFWIITVIQKGRKDNNWEGLGFFRVFSIDQNGIKHENDYDMQFKATEYAYLKGSPDGTKIAFTNSRSHKKHSVKTAVEVFNFDNQTGNIDISSRRTFAKPSSPNEEYGGRIYGLEFSPNSNFLYFGNLNKSAGFIYRIDFNTSPNTVSMVVSNKEINNTKSNYCHVGALQLGPDGLIYCALPEQNFLAAILNPNDTNIVFQREYVSLHSDSICKMGLPNLIPNPCPDDNCNCNNGCNGCNENAAIQNEELMSRAESKTNTEPSTKNDQNCRVSPFSVPSNGGNEAMPNGSNLEPCFYFHWGDGAKDQIENHDTEVFYITVCNNYNDLLFRGLKITKVSLNPELPIESAQIVPDRFIYMDCLEPSSCQTREFAIITRDMSIAGNYTIDIEYCYDELVVVSSNANKGTASFPLEITED